MTFKNIEQLEREIEELYKFDYAYFRSHGVGESLVQQCIDNVQKPVKELRAKLKQTNEIIKIILDFENDSGLKIRQDTSDIQVINIKEIITKLKANIKNSQQIKWDMKINVLKIV